MNDLTKTIRELRVNKGYSQGQVAAKLFITTSAYSKVERSRTPLTLERLEAIAAIYGLKVSELLNYNATEPVHYNKNEISEELESLQIKITESEQIVQEKCKEIDLYRENMMSFIFDAYQEAFSYYEEPLPFEELDDVSWSYLDMLGIKTKEEYEAAGMLIGYVSEANEQQAFESMIRNMSIYKLFESGQVDDTGLMRMWETYKQTGKPIFKVEGNSISRIIDDEPPF